MLSSLKNKRAIAQFCKGYAATCEEQEIKAQNKLRIFSFIICYRERFENWKNAAIQGREVFSKLINDIAYPKTTIKQFTETVEKHADHFRIHAEEDNGPYWNELYNNHAEKLVAVAEMEVHWLVPWPAQSRVALNGLLRERFSTVGPADWTNVV